MIFLSVMDKFIYFLQKPQFYWEKEYPTSSYKEVLNYNPSYRRFKLPNLKNHSIKKVKCNNPGSNLLKIQCQFDEFCCL